mmetsp:Transcript_26532/g.78061  ORF Transcript_26532/g.78061 Transcript_26532/m.78061 type:complete len:292 (+) Transcript_26532:1328-2203(+)
MPRPLPTTAPCVPRTPRTAAAPLATSRRPSPQGTGTSSTTTPPTACSRPRPPFPATSRRSGPCSSRGLRPGPNPPIVAIRRLSSAAAPPRMERPQKRPSLATPQGRRPCLARRAGAPARRSVRGRTRRGPSPSVPTPRRRWRPRRRTRRRLPTLPLPRRTRLLRPPTPPMPRSRQPTPPHHAKPPASPRPPYRLRTEGRRRPARLRCCTLPRARTELGLQCHPRRPRRNSQRRLRRRLRWQRRWTRPSRQAQMRRRQRCSLRQRANRRPPGQSCGLLPMPLLPRLEPLRAG